MKRGFSFLIILILLVALVFNACTVESKTPLAEESPSATNTQEGSDSVDVRPQDDYYNYMNAEWLAQVDLEEEEPRAMRMNKLQDEINQQLQDDFAKIAEAGTESETDYLANAVTLYRLFTDVEKRSERGIEELKPYLDQVAEVQTVEELQPIYKRLMTTGTPAPFNLQVTADLMDPSVNSLLAMLPVTYLPDISYYEDEHPQGQKMLQERAFIIQNLAALAGMDEAEAAQVAEDALAFDKILSSYMLSLADQQKILTNSESYIPFEEFCSYSSVIDFEPIVTEFAGMSPDTIVIGNKDFYENIDSVISQDNIDLLKNWIIAEYLYNNSMYLSEDFYEARVTVPEQEEPDQEETQAGDAETSTDEKDVEETFSSRVEDQSIAFLMANFSTELSRYYSDNYLTAETKEAVSEMCKGIIEEYKERLRENDWMQDTTRQKAIKKLEKMNVVIGGAEVENPLTKGVNLVSAEEGGTLLQGVWAVQENAVRNMFSTLGQENTGLARANNTLAMLKSYDMNAAYIPSINSIVISTAILNEPYYSASYSDSRNYGGIGVVIGHEISHAFDQTGSLYDAEGNMQNWWEKEDREEFDARTQKMIEHFDGLPYMGGTVDGALTAEENTADAGGLSVSLEALEHSGKEVDYEEYFQAWAEVWADKATEENALLRLKTDPHSPGEFRVNRQLMLLDAFYETYGLKEGDGMFLPIEQRFQIW